MLLAVMGFAAGTVVLVALSTRGGRFSASFWKASSPEKLGYLQSNPRERMVKDLMSKNLALGIPRSEVLSLLGPPDYPSRATDESVWYFLGNSGAWRPWKLFPRENYLVLDFDTKGGLKRKRLLSRD